MTKQPKTQPLPNQSPNTMRLHKVIHDLKEKVAKLEAANGKLSIENHIKEQIIKTHCDDVITPQEAKANELDQIIKTHLGPTSNISPKRKGDMLDRYAIPAMQGLSASECEWGTTIDLASQAYDIAEAMIAERNKRTQ